MQHSIISIHKHATIATEELHAAPFVRNRVHSKQKGQNSRTFRGLLKDLKLQFSSTKSINKKTYHTRAVTTIT